MDYRKFAADELRNIEQLRAAVRICGDRLTELNESLRSCKNSSPQADPVHGGGSKTEERWLNILAAQIDEEKRYKDLRRRIRRFNTAWAVLSERDKAVLTEFYITGGSGCAERIATREHCDARTAYRWRDEALICFARAFYGGVVN